MKKHSKIFHTFDHTADLGVKVFGTNIEELFKNSVQALTKLLIGNLNLPAQSSETIELEASDREMLLHELLSETLYLFGSENIIITQIEEIILGDNNIKLKVKTCDRIKEEIEIKREIKAVTYHQFMIGRENGNYYATFVLDI